MTLDLQRRSFLTLLCSSAAAWQCDRATAQTPSKLLRLGMPSTSLRASIQLAAFEQRMRELGYLEGQNLTVEFINVRNQLDRAVEATQELIQRKVDIILADSGLAIDAAAAATNTLPIVMVAINVDPVARGYVASIARPSGNITGVYFRRPELVGKQIEILSETFPEKTRLGVLWDMYSAEMFSAAVAAAASLHLKLHPLKLENSPYDFVTAFRSLTQGGAQMLLVLSSTLFNQDRSHIAALALQHGLPTMFVGRTYADAGGLLSYGPSLTGMYRRAADYVDRLAKGAKPADLPIEQPTKFELVLNLKTAKALGLSVPASIRLRADEVIE